MPAFLSTKGEFDRCLSQNPAVVVDFTASWCGPCQLIAPFFAELEGQFPTVVFRKVDVDANREAAAAASVTAMPTFVMYVNGRNVDSVKGADQDGLRSMIQRHAPAARAAMPKREPHKSAGIFAKMDAAAAVAEVQATDGILVAFACGEDPGSITMRETLDSARFATIATQYKLVFLQLKAGTPDFDNFKVLYPVVSTPMVFFVGPTGVVLQFFAGVKTEGEVREVLRAAIAHKKGTAAGAGTPAEGGPAGDVPAEESPQSVPTEEGSGAESSTTGTAREKARKLQEEIRQKQLAQEKEQALQDEVRRRADGKALADVKRRSEDQKRQAALELMAKKRRDEDEQDRLHRERVRKQLEADKKARQHRKAVAEGGVPAEGTSEAKPPVSAAATETTASAAATAPSPAASSSSGTARIKVTLLSGEIITETFQPTDPFQVILDFVAAHQSESPITLLQTFPRRRLTAADAATTLEALGFVPNIALTCAPVENHSILIGSFGRHRSPSPLRVGKQFLRR